MAAYAALVSLSKVIDLILPQNQAYIHLCSREEMMSLQETVARLQEVLEDLSGRSHSSIQELEGRIRDVAYRLEDIIESGMPNSLCEKLTSLCMRLLPVAITPFGRCNKKFAILLKEAMGMKELNLQDKDTSGPSHPMTTTTSSSKAPTAKLDIDEVPVKIMDWVFRRGSKLEIIPITGMGGIGKTTLARAVYQHPNTQRHFDICSWVTISQEYNVKEILRGLLPPEQQNAPDERLIEYVHKRMIGRRFLIVLDDMWDEKAWDRMRNAFPDDNRGSRIILTTRLLDVAAYVGSSSHAHEMQFLNDEQSWDLLRKKLDGCELWPKELEDLGRTISRNCRGLPLAVVAMAGLLKFNMSEEYWKRIAKNTKSEDATDYDDHLFSILALSYAKLPPYLKACFLYLGSFKEDYEIPTEELVRLWTAELFLKPSGSKEMEEVAEEYLEELVARSLVLVQKKRHDGRIKTCSLHDALRDLSIRKAHEEKFSQHITWKNRYSINNDLRRASVTSGCFTKELARQTHVRSLRQNEHEEVLSLIQHFVLIRVLVVRVRIDEDSQFSNLYQLTNLRYLHIHLISAIGFGMHLTVTVGKSISKLQNLETLIFSGTREIDHGVYRLHLPTEMWDMQRLRHLILVKASKLPCPSLSEISCSGLQTLTKVTNFNLTRSMAAILSDLKKLKLLYDNGIREDRNHYGFHLDNLVHLHQLEELTIASNRFTEVTDLSFPRKLKKLSLQETQMPVENMSLIGSLPNLEVLKLKCRSVGGKEWEPVEGEFVQLKYLKMQQLSLRQWRAESEHFPQLETLIIKRCRQLKEVPAEIGEINTLQKLVLDNCKDAEESVEEIKAEQESLCNDFLQVIIIRADVTKSCR